MRAPEAVDARPQPAAAGTLRRIVGVPDRRAAMRLAAALATSAVLAQLAYPRVEGAARDDLTVTSVVLFAMASLTHAATVHGAAAAARVAAVLAGGGLAVEVLGVATGYPFGGYAYTDRLGPMVADVPLLIPLAWAMMGWPALVVARRITRNGLAGPLVGAVALATWDLFLDPQMVAEGYWTWDAAGPHLLGAIPVSNYLAWLATAWAMMLALWPLTRAWPRDTDDRVPVALYLWTWLGSTVAHAGILGLPGSALLGGLGMGAVVVLLLRTGVADRSRPAGGRV